MTSKIAKTRKSATSRYSAAVNLAQSRWSVISRILGSLPFDTEPLKLPIGEFSDLSREKLFLLLEQLVPELKRMQEERRDLRRAVGGIGKNMLNLFRELEFFKADFHQNDHRVGVSAGRLQQALTKAQRAIKASQEDELTGLLNRRGYKAELKKLLDHPRRRRLEFKRADEIPEKTFLAIWLMDIDRFKGINDSLGHDAGDQVLQRVATIIRDHLRGICVRWGGDEFLVLVQGLSAIEQVFPITNRLSEALRKHDWHGEIVSPALERLKRTKREKVKKMYLERVELSVGLLVCEVRVYPRNLKALNAVMKSAREVVDSLLYEMKSSEKGSGMFSWRQGIIMDDKLELIPAHLS